MPVVKTGVGVTAIEAMAMGKPLVTSGVGELLHLVRDGETGLVFPEGDAQALADRILHLLRDPSELTRIGTALGVGLAPQHPTASQEMDIRVLIICGTLLGGSAFKLNPLAEPLAGQAPQQPPPQEPPEQMPAEQQCPSEEPPVVPPTSPFWERGRPKQPPREPTLASPAGIQ